MPKKILAGLAMAAVTATMMHAQAPQGRGAAQSPRLDRQDLQVMIQHIAIQIPAGEPRMHGHDVTARDGYEAVLLRRPGPSDRCDQLLRTAPRSS